MNIVRESMLGATRVYQFVIVLAYLFFSRPISFLKSISRANFRKLTLAFREEPVDQIIKNGQVYLDPDHVEGEEGPHRAIDRFIKGIKSDANIGNLQLFVSHEASRTGAPMIVFKVAEHYELEGNIRSIFILCRGGEILSEFVARFPCYILQSRSEGKFRDRELALLFGALAREFGIRSGIVNSVESLSVLSPMYHAGMANITMLVHEMGNFYEAGAWRDIEKYATRVIFPAQFIKKRAVENSPLQTPEIFVRGQGLLNDTVLIEPREKWRCQVRSELNIPQSATIILSCGSTIARKGVDIFSFTAISVLNQCSSDEAPYFVWLGSAPSNHFMKWVERDVALSGMGRHIIFAGARDLSAHYFLACDIFFMTSRGDPFPCVVQEAMAAGAPIVGFHNSGGYPEMLYEDNSFLHAYGDIAGATGTLRKLIQDPEIYKSKVEDTRKFAARQFDFGAYADFLIEITSKENSEVQ